MKAPKIQTNNFGHRVMIVDELYTPSRAAAIKRSEIDAIWFQSMKVSDFEENFLLINPIARANYCYIPFFFSPELEVEPEMQEVADGVIFGIEDPVLITKTRMIKERISLYQLPFLIVDTRSESELQMQMVYFFLSRSNSLPKMRLLSGSTLGYSSPLPEFFIRKKRLSIMQIMKSMINLLEKRYIINTHYVDTVHVCPKCHHTHLLYTEVCPRCGSGEIVSEPVIHHFPCANISPESRYVKDGELICPKCAKKLRHIGVDYDRPAEVVTCSHCKGSFSNTEMRVTCTSCHEVHRPNELIQIPIYDARFTEEGIDKLKHMSKEEVLNQSRLYEGLVSLRSLLEYVESRIDRQDQIQTDKPIMIARFTFQEDLLTREMYRISAVLCSLFVQNIIAVDRNRVLIAVFDKYEEEMEEFLGKADTRLSDELMAVAEGNWQIDFVAYTKGSDKQDFLRRL